MAAPNIQMQTAVPKCHGFCVRKMRAISGRR
jgi:hypothetical protein